MRAAQKKSKYMPSKKKKDNRVVKCLCPYNGATASHLLCGRRATKKKNQKKDNRIVKCLCPYKISKRFSNILKYTVLLRFLLVFIWQREIFFFKSTEFFLISKRFSNILEYTVLLRFSGTQYSSTQYIEWPLLSP